MPNKSVLKVTTHVGRDLLQSAAGFKADHAVVWEYVVNGLQYVDEGTLPKVQVTVRPRAKEIEIADNGRGMNQPDLERFFTMHAENMDRLKGRPGRGKFGTGKAAAFGIGQSLKVETRRGGVRNVVLLTREEIASSRGDDVPIGWLVRNDPTSLPNGTTVTVGDIVLPKINTPAIIEYIERHLRAYKARLPQVAVNEHVCQYREPQVIETIVFRPSAQQAKVIGDVELTVSVAQAPLPASEVGIAITSGAGNLVAIESAGVDRKELGIYLFGAIDVPLLETVESPIQPFDGSRSLQLNPLHPVCAVLIPFVGSKLEEVRVRHLRRLRDAQKTEQARRLASEADRIAEILNDDFKSIAAKLEGIRAVASHPGSAGARFGKALGGDVDESRWIEGMSHPGDVEQCDKSRSSKPESLSRPAKPPEIVKSGSPNVDGAAAVDPIGGGGASARPRGGFRVEYRELGHSEDRSKYDRTSLTILINLDHPAARNAMRAAGVEDPNFKRLSYEIAFTEYSVALGYEMAERDPDIPADDLLYEVRSTLNRVAASAAALYA